MGGGRGVSLSPKVSPLPARREIKNGDVWQCHGHRMQPGVGLGTEHIMCVLGERLSRRAGRELCSARSQLFALIPIPASTWNKDGCWVYSGLYVASFP